MSGLSAPILIKSFLFQEHAAAADNMLQQSRGGRCYCVLSGMGMILSLLLEFADVIKSHPRPLLWSPHTNRKRVVPKVINTHSRGAHTHIHERAAILPSGGSEYIWGERGLPTVFIVTPETLILHYHLSCSCIIK
jgi:hypothetical protein